MLAHHGTGLREWRQNISNRVYPAPTRERFEMTSLELVPVDDRAGIGPFLGQSDGRRGQSNKSTLPLVNFPSIL